MDFSLADVVKSMKGRDAGRYFFVVKLMDEDFIAVADGDLRRIDNPKKKRRKHVKAVGFQSVFLKQKLEAGQKVTNAELRKNLESLLENENLK